jgi:hypothetical protein
MTMKEYAKLKEADIVHVNSDVAERFPELFTKDMPYRVRVRDANDKTIIVDNYDEVNLWWHYDDFHLKEV